jgi:hypothetical protein
MKKIVINNPAIAGLPDQESTGGPPPRTMTEGSRKKKEILCHDTDHDVQLQKLPHSVRNGRAAGTDALNEITFNKFFKIVTDRTLTAIRQNLLDLS